MYDHVGENNLCLLIVFFSGTGILISFIDRFKDFTIGLTGIKGTLAEIKQTEVSVKELGKAIHDVFETKSHAIMDETSIWPFESSSTYALRGKNLGNFLRGGFE